MLRDITVNTKLAAIIGTDIGHSKSPAMMNAAFQEKNLDYYYYAMNIKEEHFGDVIKGISKMNFAGLTITIPYKIQVIQYLDEIDPLAEIIGAVNTIKVQDGKLKGYNTDGAGFVRGLEVDCGVHVPDHTFFIVGAGGVSRAITTVLASKHPKKIYLANRTTSKANEICSRLNQEFGHDLCIPLSLEDDIKSYIDQSSVLINTTNLGMPPYEDQCAINLSLLRPELLVADVIYNPKKTLLLQTAEQLGCQIVNGQSLLLHQGKIAFQIWTGLEAPDEVMANAVFK